MSAPIDLAVFLVAEGCVPMVAGVQPARPAPQGAALPASERAKLGFAGPGVTLRYEGGVIADFGAETATIVAEGDGETGLAALDKAIRAGVGDVQQTEESPPGQARRRRTYFLRVSDRRYARVTADYGAGGPLEFRVTGMAAISYTSRAAALA